LVPEHRCPADPRLGLKRAERLNGRLAMLGFLIGVAIEALTGHGILQQLADVALLSQG
jgi:hypothetical protein